jgi:predicted dehydrogenase
MTAAQGRASVTVAGTGPESERWARALQGCGGMELEPLTGASDDDLLESLARPHLDAIAFASYAGDLPRAIRRAIMAGRHIFVCTPAALSAKHLASLDDLARRRGRLLLFDTPALGDGNIAFVRRMTGGPNALWRQRYVRSLRTGAQVLRTLDELAIVDIGTVLALAGAAPASIGAVAPRIDEEAGAAGVAMITLMFEGGVAARVDVSLIEPEARHEIAVACEGRTVLLDALNMRAPMQIQAAAGHRGPRRGEQWAETVIERPQSDVVDHAARAASLFVDALRQHDTAATNAREIAQAALAWETARRSIEAGGEMLAVSGAVLAEHRRPALQLIQGGGQRSEDRSAPALSIVG